MAKLKPQERVKSKQRTYFLLDEQLLLPDLFRLELEAEAEVVVDEVAGLEVGDRNVGDVSELVDVDGQRRRRRTFVRF